MTLVGAAAGAAGERKAMKEKTITVSHEVSPEYRKPKCLLFNCWLEEPYKKCEACRKACREENEK